MSSCFGFRRRGDDQEPLLPQYQDDTHRERALHQKLHTYQMYRALGKGYMPTNEQTIIHLRTLLAADLLNPDNPDLSDSGRLLTKNAKRFLSQFIELLQHKNSQDQIQDFLWYLSKSKVSVDTDDIVHTASQAKSKANTAAAFQSLHTVGSLLLTNSDFRLFLSDMGVISREVFKDTAFTLSEVAEDAGKKLEPSEEEQEAVKEPGKDVALASNQDDLEDGVTEVSQVIGNSATKVAEEAKDSMADKLSGDEKKTLVNRLQQAVAKLRRRPDYNDSVSTIALLIKRYAVSYSRAVEETIDTAKRDVHNNSELDRALRNFWQLARSFGKQSEWDELERRFDHLMSHRTDPDFENLMVELGNTIQELLTNPAFFDHAKERFQELQQQAQKRSGGPSLHDDVELFTTQLRTTFHYVLQDEDVMKLINTASNLTSILSPQNHYINKDLLADSLNVFIPLFIQLIQYIPVPRLEVATPEIDILLENLIIEPGRTVNHSSFLPYRFKAITNSEIEIRKARFRTHSHASTLVTLQFDGLTARAEELGFWMRAHTGLLRLADAGIASFALDERGMDIHIDVEVGQERLEQMLTLRAVRVHVHKLRYDLRKSKFSWLSWLIKPLLRPILRKTIEKQAAAGIADLLHAANRELIFARERLRATRIADPQDLLTFIKAVAARLVPEEDPDLYTRVGFDEPGEGIFKGRYAPGSLVKVWNEEAAHAGERVDDQGEVHSWKNEVFDLHTQAMA